MDFPLILFFACIGLFVLVFGRAGYVTLRNKFRAIDADRNAAKAARQDAARIRAVEANQRRELAAKTLPGKQEILRTNDARRTGR